MGSRSGRIGGMKLPRFRLRTLLIAIALLSIPMGWAAWQLHIVQERKAIRAMLKARNSQLSGLEAFTNNDPKLRWYRTMLGDVTTGNIYLDGDEFTKAEIDRIIAALPEIDFAILRGWKEKGVFDCDSELVRGSERDTPAR
jgi:hypothetical protein